MENRHYFLSTFETRRRTSSTCSSWEGGARTEKAHVTPPSTHIDPINELTDKNYQSPYHHTGVNLPANITSTSPNSLLRSPFSFADVFLRSGFWFSTFSGPLRFILQLPISTNQRQSTKSGQNNSQSIITSVISRVRVNDWQSRSWAPCSKMLFL